MFDNDRYILDSKYSDVLFYVFTFYIKNALIFIFNIFSADRKVNLVGNFRRDLN